MGPATGSHSNPRAPADRCFVEPRRVVGGTPRHKEPRKRLPWGWCLIWQPASQKKGSRSRPLRRKHFLLEVTAHVADTNIEIWDIEDEASIRLVLRIMQPLAMPQNDNNGHAHLGSKAQWLAHHCACKPNLRSGHMHRQSPSHFSAPCVAPKKYRRMHCTGAV